MIADTMTDEEKRVRIAELCGWKHYGCTGCARTPCVCRDYVSADGEVGEIPDYLNDLNAMHEAEKVMSFSARQDYVMRLRQVISKPIADAGRIVTESSAVFATARQRAEAFLLTLDK